MRLATHGSRTGKASRPRRAKALDEAASGAPVRAARSVTGHRGKSLFPNAHEKGRRAPASSAGKRQQADVPQQGPRNAATLFSGRTTTGSFTGRTTTGAKKTQDAAAGPADAPATHEARFLPVFGVQKIEDAPATHEARLCAKERAPSRLFGVRTRPFRPLPGGQTRPQSRTRRARYRAFPAPAADSSNSPVSCRSRPP